MERELGLDEASQHIELAGEHKISLDRKSLFKWGAAGGAAVLLGPKVALGAAKPPPPPSPGPPPVRSYACASYCSAPALIVRPNGDFL